MLRKILTGFIGAMSLLSVSAGTMNSLPSSSMFYIGAFGGYGVVNGAYGQDGHFTQGRATIGAHAINFSRFILGAELGIQSGNIMRLAASPELIERAGGLPIQSTLKPFFDVLVIGKYQSLFINRMNMIVKAGMAYRQLQFIDRSSLRDHLNKINPEFQVGLGYSITPNVMLIALYQGIYSAQNAGIERTSAENLIMSKIPTQQAGFLGVEASFF